MDTEPTTGELRVEQVRREIDERERAEQASEEERADQHGRRADKAAYLKQKLAQREEAERRAAADDESEGTER